MKSKKSLRDERLAARKAAVAGLEKEYDDLARRVDEISSRRSAPGTSDYSEEDETALFRWSLLTSAGNLGRDEFVRRRIDRFDSWEPGFISGPYRDEQEIRGKHQQAYIEYLRQVSPHVFEELRHLRDAYIEAFDDNGEAYRRLSDPLIIGELFEPSETLDDLFQRRRIDFEGAGLIFASEQESQVEMPCFDWDFNWGRYRRLLELLDWMKSPSKTGQIAEEPETLLLVTRARKNLGQFLGNREKTPARVDALVELQLGLLRWGQRHFAGKDWLLRYAAFFIGQFAKNSIVQVEDLSVPRLTLLSLVTGPFNFEFPGWLPGKMSSQDYQEAVRKELDNALFDYVQFWGQRLELDQLQPGNTKIVTRPIDSEFESIKWLLAWNDGATYPQIGKCFNKSTHTIKHAFPRLSAFSLPVRVGKHGRVKRPMPEHRLAAIKAIKTIQDLSE